MMLPAYRKLLDEVAVDAARGTPRLDDTPAFLVPVDRYLSEERLAREQALMRRMPIIVAHASELAEPTSCLRVDRLGVSAIVVRGRDGRLRAFLNACRHRGTQLLDAAQPAEDGGEMAPSCRKSFICPYHGWTYDLTGELLHMPHERAFADVDPAERGLVELPVTSAHGLVWLTLTPGAAHDVDELLGPVADDLDALGFADHVVFRRSSTVAQANWKLLIEAFLENYHVRQLHRGTVYRFFLDGIGAYEPDGPHIRALSARRAILEQGAESARTNDDLRTLASPSYYLFPNTIVVVHPDYLSHLGIFPEGVDRLRSVHCMLVPKDRAAEREHWDKSFALIDGGVFGSEDYAIVAKMQAGIATGANQHLTFGRMEQTIRWFHNALDGVLAAG
jgi:phenylpropionate dioxygenase-like ring-hydroxylating dioxygenase large terminal subunit